MLFRKSKYRKIIRSFSKFFGQINKITSRKRVNVTGWRFVFAGLGIFIIFGYFLPFSGLFNYLGAFGGHTEIISLYANQMETEETSNFNEGWHGKEKAQGMQDLGPNAAMLEFSDENSAFYAGGNYSLIAGNFQFLSEDINRLIENEQNVEEQPEEEPLLIDDELGDGVSEEINEIMEIGEINEIEEIEEIKEIGEIENYVDLPVEAVEAEEENTSELVKDVAENSITDSVQAENNVQPNDETVDNQNSDLGVITEESEDTENIETVIEELEENQEPVLVEPIPSADVEADAEVIGTEASVSEEIISFLNGIKKIFTIAIAQAQSFVSTEIKTLADLGTYKSAVINLSLASYTGAVSGEVNGIEENINEERASDIDGENISDSDLTGEIIDDQIEAIDDEPLMIVWYSLADNEEADASSTDKRLWQKLDEIRPGNFSNAENNGYLSFAAPFLESWQDIENLKIKLEVLDNGSNNLIYLDSIWVESVFERESELDKLKQRQRWEEALQTLSDNLIFKAGETGELKFQYNKNEERIWETIGEFFGIGNFWKNVDLRIALIDPSGVEIDAALITIFESDGTFTVRLPDTNVLMPGLYRLQFSIKDYSGEETEEFIRVQEFYWGVLAMNFNKSEYQKNESGFIQMAVLDNGGHTICDASLDLEIKDPNGNSRYFSTSEIDELLKIVVSDECGPVTVTNVPDYSVHYQFAGVGSYEFILKAKTAAGEKMITEIIEVKDAGAFSIERFGSTRIWPKADYVMRMDVFSKEDFVGNIVETVPSGFKINNANLRINANTANSNDANYDQYLEQIVDDKKELIWKNVALKAGDVLEISYTFDAPDRSPELYLLGPLAIQIENRKSKIENRSWQIASDSFAKRARTVMFQAGTYNDSAGGTGQNTNTDYTLTAFNWKLVESGVAIKSAYIIMETQFEAYNTTGIDYNGYKLGFDACVEDCTAAAFGIGSGQVLDDNNSIFVYDEIESNNGRLLLDVTSEAQIAAYTGEGVLLESQFGYRLKNSTIYSSIASVSALLVVTYTYDIDSPNITNTVTYPLDSTIGTNNGSLQASQAACTADSNCPVFGYNMQIPEWPGTATTSNRISQWFKMYAAPQGNTNTDLRPYLDIQTFNVDSSPFHFEEALSSNGNTPPMFFPEWSGSGYAENQSQQAELFVNTTNYMLGGEVFETYSASSSAPIKTRTVSFPMGVIANGGATGLNSQTANVYFPENGNTTGTVSIKSAWIRLTINGHTTSNQTYSAVVSTKTGNNATSANLTYQYRAPIVVTSPILNIVHIIPASDYSELEQANTLTGKAVTVNLSYSNAGFGGASAELMITYTYSGEENGYLSSLNLFGGQASVAPATSVSLLTASAVFPEAASTVLHAAALRASYLNSDTASAMGTGVHLSTANLSITTPDCSSLAYQARPDGVNMASEMLIDVSGNMTTTNDQTYFACYASNNTSLTTDVAKMNGQLIYTYGWTNTPPTGTFNSAEVRRDASAIVDIEIEIDDIDDHDSRAKIEFATGTECLFNDPGDPYLDETDSNINADYADPYIDNSEPYQIGTANGYIKTASGSNSVFFDWLAKGDLGETESDYCLRLTANDAYADQAQPATTTVYIDTLPPSPPGALSLVERTGTSVTLAFGATSTETNFNEYKIFYKQANGTDPAENDSVWASTSDINLYDKFFNNKATTTINVGLIASTTYSFAIWAYDAYGNKASSTRIDITTNDAPLGLFNTTDTKQRTDGSGIADISIEIDDLNNQDAVKAKIEAATGTECDFSQRIDPSLDENQANITADFGTPLLENDWEYQIGGFGAWIMTSPGSNTINFDWLTKTDLPFGNETYCLRLTANDGFDDQSPLATATIVIDNVPPTPAGSLSAAATAVDSITLAYNLDLIGQDTNEPMQNAYKIYYKQGTSGVSEGGGGEIEIDNSNLDSYDYNNATSTVVSGLTENTWYVFKIWTYDAFGNKASSSEVAIKTAAAIAIQSFAFTNAYSEGPNTNIAAAINGEEWNFRAIITHVNGWQAISSTTLYLADNSDLAAPYSDLAFNWNQTGQIFSEIGNDVNGAAVLSSNSTSTCENLSCTINFKVIFNKLFTDTNTNYPAILVADSDSGITVENAYADFYQVRFPYVEQTNYRWRNDDGGG